MNAHAKTIEPTSDNTVVALIEANPVVAFTNPEKFDAFYEKVAAEVRGHVPDLTTDKGRKAIASLAYKVARSKTALDEAGKALTEDKRAEIKKVDEARKVIRDKLDALKEEARKPLTEWEQAEKDRVQQVADWFAAAERALVILNDDTSDAVAERVSAYEAMTLNAAIFGDSLERADAVRHQTIEVLRAAHARLVQDEADRAELARLREAAAARDEEQRLAKEAEEAKAKAEADAKAAEEREAQIARQAAEDAKAEAARLAQKALDDQAAAHQAELARLQKIADDKAAAEAAEAEAAAQREKNCAHVAKVMGAAKLALMGLGVSEEQAREIVRAIKAGSVPNITINF